MQVRPIGSVESGKPVTNYLVANRHALPLLAPRPQVSLCSDGVLAASWLHCAVYRHVKAAQLPSGRLGCSRCQPFVRRRYVSGTPFPVPKKQTQKPVREAPQEEELCDFELERQAQLRAVCVGGRGGEGWRCDARGGEVREGSTLTHAQAVKSSQVKSSQVKSSQV